MTRHLFAAGSLIFIAAICFASGGDGDKPPATSINSGFPSEIKFRSSVGEVTFPHQMHIKDFGVNCVECHHQISARKLSTPHPDYLKSSWINCKTCHSESGKDQQVFACSECHRTNPKNIADETLSAKVVIHKRCWKCHQAGTGKEASMSCEKCHTGKKSL